MTHEPAAAGGDRASPTMGWELVHVLQRSLVSLEYASARVLAAEVAGLITLWTQLSTFEDGPPRVLAWLAWLTFIAAISVGGVLLRPRRLVRFWDRLLPPGMVGTARRRSAEEEARCIEEVWSALRKQRDSLDRSIALSVRLGILALGLVAVAYAIERAWYAP